ncbi:hypothetical protein SCLCIDRAFT_28116 [Scleroderma citrinum Foug A]|uniref:Uncharacterized protein n=1 Tax=Scleroderma citrinum Foug A TaxID=1036808 RepID=A0A0C3DC82_9AGAM|nr:hypothetical protein SCLCIDRAFT_28116 [Scleroderma citrinum Foug A]
MLPPDNEKLFLNLHQALHVGHSWAFRIGGFKMVGQQHTGCTTSAVECPSALGAFGVAAVDGPGVGPLLGSRCRFDARGVVCRGASGGSGDAGR